MDEFDLKKIAYHEAGHAVAHFIFHRRFSNISVVSKGDVLGEVYDPELTLSLATIYITGRSRFFFRTEKRLFQEVLISLAGVAAEAILKKEAVISYVKENLPSLIRDMRTLDVFLKMSNWPEWSGNFVHFSNEGEEHTHFEEFLIQIYKLLKRPKYRLAIQSLANGLMLCGEIKYSKARKIIKEAGFPFI